ncbi:MAG TPA: PKD domain-containing protein [Bacteroidia bacterium]
MIASIKKYLLLFFFLSPAILFAGDIRTPKKSQAGIKFTENKNQWERNVLYRAHLDGGALFLEKNCFTYNFYDKETLRKNHVGGKGNSINIATHAFRMTFLNSSSAVTHSSTAPTPDYCNFFMGNDKSKWSSAVRNFKEVNYQELYKGIGLQVLGKENNIKYNFIVAPNGDPNEIRLLYEGLDNISLKNGSLVLKTSLNEMVEQEPYAYQVIDGKEVEVPCKFVLKDNIVHFKFPRGYDKTKELIIDPVLVFAASSGSIADNFGMTATYDSDGNLYSGGIAYGVGYPTTVGAFDPSWNGSSTYIYGRTDVVITKYDSSGAFLQYSTYLGGFTGTEVVTSLVVNAQDELFLYGATGSTDFPVSANAYDATFNGGIAMYFYNNGTYFYGGTDIYLAKFNSAGTSLLGSTYIGGSLNDGTNYNNDSVFINNFFDPVAGQSMPVYESQYDSLQYNYGDQYRGEINVDQYGNVYINSSTRSSDFPMVNSIDNTLGGKQDAVVMKLNPDLSQLLWSTFLGGSDNDAGYAIAIDDSSNVCVAGGTRSLDFSTTPGVLRPSYSGGQADGFITRIKGDGSAMIASTYWGTAQYDQTYFVQLDKDGDVYVVGQTRGSMPVTPGTYNNPGSGQFITKINDSLNTVIFSTVFGNGTPFPTISPSAFLVDYCENIYVSGWGGNILTGSLTGGMPITPNAIQPSTDGFNFYLLVLSTNASSLLYGSYFGGGQSREHVDGGTSRFDKKGIVYQSVCAGCGGYDDFPVTPGAWPGTPGNPNHNTQNNNCNNGVFRLDFQVPLAQANFTVDHIDGCAPLTVEFQNQSGTGGTFLWDFGGGDTTSSVLNPVHTFPDAGTYMVQLIVNKPGSCNIYDTAFQYVTVYPGITASFNYASLQCTNQVNFNDSSFSAPVSWEWNFGDSDSASIQNPSHLYDSAGVYNVQLITQTVNGCADTISIPVNLVGPPPVSVTPADTICTGTSIQLNAGGGFAYSWSPAGSLNNPNIANPVASPDTATTYTVTIQTVNSSNDTCPLVLTTTVYLKADTTQFSSPVTSGCDPLTIQFTNENPSSSVYLWNFGNGNTTSTVFNPSQTFTPSGNYVVQLYSKDTASCSTWDTVSLSITVFPGINADFDFAALPCTDLFSFYDSSAVAPVSWEWDFDDGGTSTLQNPTHLFAAAGSYDVELVTSTINGCSDTTTVQVSYNGATTTISPDDTICIEKNGTQLLATGGFAYSWSPSASLSSSVIANPVANPAVTTTYTATISTINSLGDTCLQTQSTTVYVIDPNIYPLSATANSDTIPEGTATVIHAITDTNLTVTWFPVTGVSNIHGFHPEVSPTETTTYTVSILDSTGCPRTASVTIYVVSMQCKADNVFVPNTFTPNMDGENDILYVRSNDITEVYFAVYNRWGQMVFETNDITKGWDGFYNGMKADPAVFAWYLRGKCYNGDELRKKGNTTLIR